MKPTKEDLARLRAASHRLADGRWRTTVEVVGEHVEMIVQEQEDAHDPR